MLRIVADNGSQEEFSMIRISKTSFVMLPDLFKIGMYCFAAKDNENGEN